MKCPVCPDVTLAMTNREGIEIDYCPSCRGVWLDRGELDKLIERSSADAMAPGNQRHPRAPQSRYEHERHPERGREYENDYRKRRRKGLLSDLFDFD